MRIEKIIKKEEEAPKIIINIEVWRKMKEYVKQASTEVGWLALVKKDERNNEYTIYETLICEQEVSGATTDLHEKGLQKIAEQLIEQGREDELNNVRCWAHSHVNMSTSPSATDGETFKEYYEQCGDYFIRLIMNKKGDYNIDLADYSLGLIYKDMGITLMYTHEEFELLERKERLEDELNEVKEKIEELTKKEKEELEREVKEELKEYLKKESGNKFNNYYSKYYNYNKRDEKEIEKIDEILRQMKDERMMVKTRNGKEFLTEVLKPKKVLELGDKTTYQIKTELQKMWALNNYSWGDWVNLEEAIMVYCAEYEDYEYALSDEAFCEVLY